MNSNDELEQYADLVASRLPKDEPFGAWRYELEYSKRWPAVRAIGTYASSEGMYDLIVWTPMRIPDANSLRIVSCRLAITLNGTAVTGDPARMITHIINDALDRSED